MRTVLAVALVVLVLSAGCTGPGGGNQTDTTLVDGATETTSAESTRTATTEETTTETTTRTTTPATADDPEKGDQFLSVSQLNESQAMAWNASKRATFGNLSEERQQVVTRAIECNCNVELDGEFSFHDETRIEVVRYEGTYYFLRVSIV